MKRVLPVVAILAIVAVVLWHSGLPERLGLRASENGTLVLYGNVDIRTATLGFRVSGRIARLAVDEGDVVKQGDLLAELEPTPFNEAVNLAKATVAARQAALDKLIAGPRAAEIASARAVVAERQADAELAATSLKRAQQLRPRDTVSQATLDEAKAASDAANARADAAQSDLDLLLEGNRKEDIDAGRADLNAAKASLASAETDLADTRLLAPEGGVINSRVEEIGAVVSATEAVLVLSLTDPVYVRAYVSEPELGRVQPGLAVTITTDGGASYEGSIGYVSPVAEFTPKQVETPDLRTDLVYRFRVVVKSPGPDLRQGMPVTVRIHEDAAS
ncbi:secretion protein HlyD [Acuticoccus mangrovi]|uniref:Secretion protein HlyD n=1 Tax=Acuticoccus mangrovi TaxID=2796142 RepID=A0A934ILZ5_9HYPH|nr:secretion protein HlyD [Acuticoccus mangrovi]MBJ3774861.1 secretion protein HlyD [Acuticoccus mangrovi]